MYDLETSESFENTGYRESTENQLNFHKIVNQAENLSEIFFALTRHLRQKFDINKGVLLLRREQPAQLAAVSTWNNGTGRDGLALSLPCKSSLFEQVARHGEVYTENYCDSFSGNFFERKLLLDDNSRSFVLQPLKSDGQVVGLLGYSSETPTAFTLFEEGTLNGIADKLGLIIQSQNYYI